MGVAGGLVPSPSALIVLLSAIALGRTAFGVMLVLGYGLGMAATLTLAGLLLVRVRDRIQRRAGRGWPRTSAIARRWTAISPYAMALFVLAVGTGIALRGFGSL
jgi:nickel/cobalt exporter